MTIRRCFVCRQAFYLTEPAYMQHVRACIEMLRKKSEVR